MKYLKLGEKASIFFDPTTRLLIRGKEVIALKAIQKSKKLSTALNQGHVVNATEEDFNNWIDGVETEVKALEEGHIDPLSELSEADFKKTVKESGFTATDQKFILKAENKVKAYRDIEKTYE